MAVQPEQQGVAYVTQFGEPFHLCGHLVEHISVGHEIMLSVTFQHEVFHDVQIGELQGSQIVEKIIMVPPYINDFRSMLLHHFHDDFEEMRVLLFPFADSGLLQMPSVDDVSVHDQAVTVHPSQEVADLVYFRMGCPQMNV